MADVKRLGVRLSLDEHQGTNFATFSLVLEGLLSISNSLIV